MSVTNVKVPSYAEPASDLLGSSHPVSNVASHGEIQMPNPEYAAYQPAAPYFDLVRNALGDLVEGEHFFDVLTDDTIYEVLYDVPGWPRISWRL